MGRLPRALTAGLVLAVLSTGAPPPVRAHALVVESFPRAHAVVVVSPPRIVLRFNSRIEKAFSSVALTGPGGRPVPLPVAAPDPAPNLLTLPLPPLEPGGYVVRWKVLSADGHVTVGAFRFTVASGR
jgi:methionine-rich copper-binding protein CopC